MNLKQKLAAYNNLKAPQHVEKDIDLLKKKAPEHSVLKSTSKGDRFANEVLRALIDHVDSEKEIVDNRRAISRNPLEEFGITVNRIKEHFSAFGVDGDDAAREKAAAAISGLLPTIPDDIQKYLPGEIEEFRFELIKKWKGKHIVRQSAKKAALLHKTPTPEARKVIMDEITEMVKDFPEEMQKTMLKLPKSICEKMDNATPAPDKNTEAADLIQEQKEELEAKEKTIQEQAENIEQKEGEVSDLEDQLGESESEKEELEEKLEETEEEKEKLQAENDLMKADLSKLGYNEKVSILFALNLDEGLPDKKADTITPVLKKKQDELLAAAGGQKKS